MRPSVSHLFATLSSATFAQALPSCPSGAPSVPGWTITNYLYMVYDEVQPDGQEVMTASVSLDVIGGFTNRSLHCESSGPEIAWNNAILNDLSLEKPFRDLWRECIPITNTSHPNKSETGSKNAGSEGLGYTTTFRYNPLENNVVSIREMANCGNDNQTAVFKGSAVYTEFNTVDHTSADPPPTMPPEGINLRWWQRLRNPTGSAPGSLLITDPAPPTPKCSSSSPPAGGIEWEVTDFNLFASCNCPPRLWDPASAGFRTQFNLINPAIGGKGGGYEVNCDYTHADLTMSPVYDWYFCGGVDPEDAPLLPGTWFRMHRESHTLSINQTWVCEGDGGEL